MTQTGLFPTKGKHSEPPEQPPQRVTVSDDADWTHPGFPAYPCKGKTAVKTLGPCAELFLM